MLNAFYVQHILRDIKFVKHLFGFVDISKTISFTIAELFFFY